MYGFLFTELISLNDVTQISQLANTLSKQDIRSKQAVESTQTGLPNMYSQYNTPSPHDYDDSGNSRIYTLLVKKKDLVKRWK